MQLYNLISSPRSAVWRQLQKLQNTVKKSQIWRPAEDIQFVFLCGANISPGIPSRRRQNLLDFASKNLPFSKFFLAESIFTILEAEGNKSNLLDIENELTDFSDFVVVILESESSFCELGAFATHDKLRKKLIIINDSNHKTSNSFINLGPIRAIEEYSSGDNVLYYKMDEDGKIHGDGIGDIFSKIFKIIHKEPAIKRTRVSDFNPNINFKKESLRFVHDLIYLTEPIYFSEISRLIKVIFSTSNDKSLQKHLGLLCATKQINRNNNGLYKSLSIKTFFEYDSFNKNDLISSFKNLYYRYDKSRLS